MQIWSHTVTHSSLAALKRAQGSSHIAVTQLASGKRLISTNIDAAAAAVAAKQLARMRSVAASVSNAELGATLLQTADSALSQIADTIIRLRELAVHASTGTLTTEDSRILQIEYDALLKGINADAKTLSLNRIPLLSGTGGDGAGNFDFRVGDSAESSIGVRIGNFAPLREATGFVALSAAQTGETLSPTTVTNDILEGTATNGILRTADDQIPAVSQLSTTNAVINPLIGEISFSGTYYAGQTVTIARSDDSNGSIGNLVVTLSRAQGNNVLTADQVAGQVQRAFSNAVKNQFEFPTVTTSGATVMLTSATTTGTGQNIQPATLRSNNFNTTVTVSPLTVGGVVYSTAATATELQKFSVTPQTSTYLVNGQFDAGDRLQFSVLDVDSGNNNFDQWITASYVVRKSDVYDQNYNRLSEQTIRDNVVAGFLASLNGQPLGSNVQATASAGESDINGAKLVFTGVGYNSFSLQTSITQSRTYDISIGGQYQSGDSVTVNVGSETITYAIAASDLMGTQEEVQEKVALGIADAVNARSLSESLVAAVYAEGAKVVVIAGQANAPTTSTGASPSITPSSSLTLTSTVNEIETSTFTLGSNWEYGDRLTLSVNGKSFTYYVLSDGMTNVDVADAIENSTIEGQSLSAFWGVSSVTNDSGVITVTSNPVTASGSSRLNAQAFSAEAAVQTIAVSGEFFASDVLRIGTNSGSKDYVVPTATNDVASVAAGFVAIPGVEDALVVARIRQSGTTIEITGLGGAPSGLYAQVISATGELSSLAAVDLRTVSHASSWLSDIDLALGNVAAQRATIGAASNRLMSASSAMQRQGASLAAANSALSDADYLAAITQLSRDQITNQAASAMLSHLALSSKIVLGLLSDRG